MEPRNNNFLINQEMVHPGALSCRGCGWSLLVRHLSAIMGEETVYVVPASCFSIIAGPYPLNMLKGSIVHTLFAAAAATATGVRAALDIKGKKNVNVVVLAGDGGTFDIGIQALSGAATRGENIIYVCNNNGAYMNTGIQTSTATPFGAATTTNPDPAYKQTYPKDLIGIIAAHRVPYIATLSLAYLDDFVNKIKKAKEITGFRFLMVDGPCPPGHKTPPEMSITLARLAVESNVFPLFEIENGKYNVTVIPEERKKIKEWVELQGRFNHLKTNGYDTVISDMQNFTDEQWTQLTRKCSEKSNVPYAERKRK
ncbi:MAG: pyruvate synthase subunit beta [Bacteroidetes bacterium]|nr:pyruvate synthase subunit beta [Bacteroidota bacterium]